MDQHNGAGFVPSGFEGPSEWITLEEPFVVRAMASCLYCQASQPVYTLADEDKTGCIDCLATISALPEQLLSALSVRRRFAYGNGRSDLDALANVCNTCDAQFEEAMLHHPREAFSPLSDVDCEGLWLVRLPLSTSVRCRAVRIPKTNGILAAYAARMDWETFCEQRERVL